MKNFYLHRVINQWAKYLIFMLVITLGTGKHYAFGEGTKQLAPKEDDRVYLALCFQKHGNLGIYDGQDNQKIYIHIEEPDEEQVFLGFSMFVTDGHFPRVGSPINAYVRIKDPTGRVVWPVKDSSNGKLVDVGGTLDKNKINDDQISSLGQVKNGPNQICTTGGYDAWAFDPKGLPKGDYSIEFSTVKDKFNQRAIFTEWWDVTVATKKDGEIPKEISGRVFSKQWALVSPSVNDGHYDFDDYFKRNFNGKVYSYAEEPHFDGGYVTEVDFQDSGFRGAQFTLAFNSTGTASTSDFEVNRKSVQNGNKLSPEFKIFLNEPDVNAYPSAEGYGEFIVEDNKYPRLFGCLGKYFFRVAVTKKGRIELLLDLDKKTPNKYDPGTRDRIITTLSHPFENEEGILIRDIPWDGKDGLGDPVPVSEIENLSLIFDYYQGTFHFPMYDVEYMTTGLVPKTIRPVTPTPYIPKLYWDDSNIHESPPAGQLKVDLTGETAPSHFWTNYNFGNENSINTYWHSYSSGTVKSCEFEFPDNECELFEPGSISGTVFEDTNRDGVKDAGEPALSGAEVKLYWDKAGNKILDDEDEPVETFVTQAPGSFGQPEGTGNYIFFPEIGKDYLVVVSSGTDLITSQNPLSYKLYTAGAEFFDQFFGVIPLPKVTLSVTDNTIEENNQTTSISANLNYPALKPVTITLDYGGDASESDYTLNPGQNATNSSTIEIPFGQSSGTINLTSVADEEDENDETVVVAISSLVNAVESGVQSEIITILDSDHAISDVSDVDESTNTVSENALASTEVGITALATDEDSDDKVSYELTNDFNGWFQINSETGIVTVLGNPDYESNLLSDHTASIEVKASSTDGSSKKATFDIAITDNGGDGGDTDHAITDLRDNDEHENAISENVTNDEPVHITALATDIDGDDITYFLLDDSNGRFKIEEISGIVSVKDDSQIDYEIDTNHSIRIEARSTDGSVIAGDFPIIVTDVDASEGDTDNLITDLDITDSDPLPNQVKENLPAGTLVNLTALTTDPDGDVVTYELLDDAEGRFSIDFETGVVSTTGPLDYETADQHTITIKAKSSDGSSTSKDFIIEVIDVNELLIANDDSFEMNEDETLSGLDLLSNDIAVEGTNLSINTSPVTDVTNGNLSIHADGTFTYIPNSNFNGTDSFVYRVCDDGEAQQCAEATVIITVKPVNDALIANNDNAEVDEDGILEGSNLLENDSDVDGDELVINETPVEDVAHGDLSIYSDGTYTYIPDADYNGTDTFVYEVCEKETSATCAQALVTITVLPVNDAPRVFDFEMEVQEASLNNPFNLQSPYDPDGDKLSVKILSTVEFGEIVLSDGRILNNNDVITIEDLLDLEYNTRERYIGEINMIYEVSDESGLSAQAQVRIRVVPIDVFIPDAVTPNDDNYNDKFTIVGLERFPDNSIQIFNRWGNIVYRMNDYDNSWDGYGNVKGQISHDRLPPGTYYYVFKFGVDKRPLSGFVYMTY